MIFSSGPVPEKDDLIAELGELIAELIAVVADRRPDSRSEKKQSEPKPSKN